MMSELNKEAIKDITSSGTILEQMGLIFHYLHYELYKRNYPKNPIAEKKMELMGRIKNLQNELYNKGHNEIALVILLLQFVVPILPDSELLERTEAIFTKQLQEDTIVTMDLMLLIFELMNYRDIAYKRSLTFTNPLMATIKRNSDSTYSPCQKELKQVFKDIYTQEKENPSVKGKNSPFAIEFEKSICPILKSHNLWQKKIKQYDGEDVEETDGEMRERLYKSIKKQYNTWHRLGNTDIDELTQNTLAVLQKTWTPVDKENLIPKELFSKGIYEALNSTKVRDKLLEMLEKLTNPE